MNYSNSEFFAYYQVYLTGKAENYKMYLAQGKAMGADELRMYFVRRPMASTQIEEAIKSVKRREV